MTPAPNDATHAALAEILARCGEDLGLLRGVDDCAAFASDASRRIAAAPELVIRPKDTAGVARALAACHAAGKSVVVQGGRTGLSGGARALPGEVVLSLERLTDCGQPDTLAGQIDVGAGSTLHKVQQIAAAAGLMFGVDIGARGTATIGGMIATNAGGIRVLRYGMMRAQVLGIEAVLSDGTILSDMRGLDKNNAGLNLTQLFVGSEGTLGVVTRAKLRLHPAPDFSTTALCAVPGIESALELLVALRKRLGGALTAFEGIWPQVYAGAVGLAGNSPLPIGAGLYLLVEMHGFAGVTQPDALEQALMDAVEAGLIADVVVAQSGREETALWRLRELCTDYTFSLGQLQPHDVSLPLRNLPEFVRRAGALVSHLDRDALVMIYGHLGDGNLHYLVKTQHRADVSAAVNQLAAELGGSITAEHGIGLDKRTYLPLVAGPAEIGAARRIIQALNPYDTLNPGRMLPQDKAAPMRGQGLRPKD